MEEVRAHWAVPGPVRRPKQRSDPGPRFRESSSAASSEESLATQNSDEEPLEGEPAEHVEAMLQKVLHPDEREQFSSDSDEDGEFGSDARSDCDSEEAVMIEGDAGGGDVVGINVWR